MLKFISEKLKAIIQYLRIIEHNIEAHYYRQPGVSEKSGLILGWAELHGGRVFIETGTWNGRTLSKVASSFDRCYSIELDEKLYVAARQRFESMPWVKLIQGDSAKALEGVLSEVDEPAVFWLDAHYCGPGTALGEGERETPVLSELNAIFKNSKFDHLILIDDARCFVGIGGYPTIRSLARFVRKNGQGYEMRISDDAIIISREEY